MQSNKERYRILCEEKNLPLFMQAWWFDAVCPPEGKEWGVLLCEDFNIGESRNGAIIGAMPYCITKKFGFKLILTPNGSQYNGVWIDYPEGMKPCKRYSFEKRVMDTLIDQLDALKISYYSQNFHHSFTNWQPFYWRGFKQTTRYTFPIPDLSNLDAVFNDFSSAKQRHIKKENVDLKVDFSFSADEFYEFHKRCLQQKNAKIGYSREFFLSMYNESVKRGQGQIIALKDNNNRIQSSVFVVWDKNTAYACIYAYNTQFKLDGASTKMFWEAIKFVSDKTRMFDFEGSMMESVAQSYQQFATEQAPYFNITKSYSKLYSLLRLLSKNGRKIFFNI